MNTLSFLYEFIIIFYEVANGAMGKSPIFVDAKRPTTSCSCARNPMCPVWPQAMSFQTLIESTFHSYHPRAPIYDAILCS